MRHLAYSTAAKSVKLAQIMRAIVVRQFGEPSVMNVENIPDPAVGPGQVLVGVSAVGVNPVDTYIRSGQYAALPALPYTPGADAAGIVEAVGNGVKGFTPGDRVYVAGTTSGLAFGAYAEKALCTADQVHPLPGHLSFAQGAAVGVPYVTAWRALFDKGHARPGETVLVHGASGAVGIAAVQIARSAGLRVLGTAGTERGRELVRQQGAHEVFDHASPDYHKAVVTKNSDRGVDLVVEMLANVNLVRDLEMIAVRGRVVIVGNRGALELNPRLIMSKDALVTGFLAWNATPLERATAHAAIVAGLERSGYAPQVGKEFPLAEAARAHEDVMKPGAYGKIVLLP
jgi:NADPH2:quinone reductase